MANLGLIEGARWRKRDKFYQEQVAKTKEEQVMNDKFKLGVGQAHEVELALQRVEIVGGWNAARLKLLCQGDRLEHVLEYTLGLAEIKSIENVINCDEKPFIPEGWQVLPEDQLPNRVTGSLKWDKKKVKLYLSNPQRKNGVIQGHELRKKLANKSVLNANVLDYLLAHPHLIPEEWKSKAVFFWGTIYRDANGDLYVRCLCWGGGGWGCYGLGGDWLGYVPAALRA